MSTPYIPETAPFSLEQRAWLNGFFAGIFSRGPTSPATKNATALPSERLIPLTILFGSQTGTAESLAKRVAKEAGRRGFAPTVLDMAQCDLTRLGTERNLLVITSTYGEGEPPDNAKALHAALATASADAAKVSQPLAQLRFSVCALGDINYIQFCKCGQDFDHFLERLGATRVVARAECDLEYEEKFAGWLANALAACGTAGSAKSESSLPAALPSTDTTGDRDAGFSRKHPFPAVLLTSRMLNAAGSAKQVNHVELSLAESGLTYEAGDALGVFPQNCPELVGQVLAALGCDGEEAVNAPNGASTSLRHALTTYYDLAKPSAELLARFTPAVAGHPGAVPQADAGQVIDVLEARRDLRLSTAEFVSLLRKLQPRLYSISSSPKAHAGQVHLTIGALRYEALGRHRKGVCSTFLTDRVTAGVTRVEVFVHSNKAFRLPENPATPVIMIGPGTGIAPFRAFLHERRSTGATGSNWLFFGDQRRATDFLYEDELAALSAAGTLTRLDTAFSRDQPEKIYVQHRMHEQARELYAWLEAGAYLYVCGDASRMAKDVDAALHAIVERVGGKPATEAAAYVQALRVAKRYARDVY